MKLILPLLLLSTCVNAQLYYGGSVGLGLGKSLDRGKIKHGINDLYLSIPVGYTAGSFIAEIQPQITASNNESISLMAGYRISGDNIGIHLLVGYTDQLAFRLKPFTVQHSFHPTGTVRVWWGQAMLQATRFNGQWWLGIGVVGF